VAYRWRGSGLRSEEYALLENPSFNETRNWRLILYSLHWTGWTANREWPGEVGSEKAEAEMRSFLESLSRTIRHSEGV